MERELVEWCWVRLGDGNVLHHLPDPGPNDDDTSLPDAVAACGLRGYASIPGVFSRMANERCVGCCVNLGFPLGKGSPKNDDECRPLVEKRIALEKIAGLG